MATSALPRGKTVDVLIKNESSFGSLPSGNWTKTFIYSHGLEQKEPFQDNNLLGTARTNNRDSLAPERGLAEVSGEIVAPIDFNHIGIWLKAAFGAASVSGASDPYTHTFPSGGEVLPHNSLEVKLASNIFMQYTGLIASRLSFELGRRAGYDRFTASLMGKSEAKATSTGGGTPADPWAIEQATAALPIFKMAGTQVAYVTGLKATYDNKIKTLDYLGSKYVSGHDLDEAATFDGQIDLRFIDATQYDIAAANAAAFTGELLWSQSANRSLSLYAANMRFERAGPKVTGPGGISQSYNFRCEQTAAAAMLVATLKSLVAAY